jgi:hypothetical protein
MLRVPPHAEKITIPSPVCRELCITPLFVIPVKTGIQKVVDNTEYRPSPV